MTNVDEFNHNECDKIDSNCVNAYVDYHLDSDNPAGLCVETSWGGDCLDLTSIVKAAETVTTLHLSPEDNPNCLEYEREDGQSDCITGDELSRIISMTKLKDVDQVTAPVNGDVYMYNNGMWYTFNLQTYMDNIATTIQNIQGAITNLQGRVTTVENTLAPIANRFEVFTNVPNDAKIMLGNINLYSDTGAAINSSGAVTSLDKNHGIYGHSLATDIAQDEIFG
jgi:hypothetical protein